MGKENKQTNEQSSKQMYKNEQSDKQMNKNEQTNKKDYEERRRN